MKRKHLAMATEAQAASDRDAVERLIEETVTPQEAREAKVLELLVETELSELPGVQENTVRHAVGLVLSKNFDIHNHPELAAQLFPGLALEERRSRACWWQAGVLLGHMFIKSRLRKEEAEAVHYGPLSDAEKLDRIGEIMFSQEPPARRRLEAAKWRACRDVEALMGDGEGESADGLI